MQELGFLRPCWRRLVLARALSTAAPAQPAGKVQPFQAIPSTGNAWINLLHFWRENRFQHMHRVMQRNFQRYGPIYSLLGLPSFQ
ncbi:cytochrome P450 11B, mitochondrial-like [Rhinatrema bivittatum]|uniref:cytochrome P450 11B, mitochondrial-like n=1 Tax=Rhinatrema bivittatum TaxID=194408 RepID=UPI00112B4D43|nr:cytochrome P450 11B, mitochondrial-like [Rhinatrema bivittatum]